MTEGFFKAIVSKSSDIIFIINHEGNFIYTNDSVYRTLGYTNEEINGTNIFEYLHQAHHNCAKEIIKYLPAEKESRQLQVRFASKKGDWRWICITLTNMLDDKFVNGIVVNAQDITGTIGKNNAALKIADKLVKEQAIELDHTLESITEGFYSLDKNHCFGFVNSIGAKIFGKEKDELLGQNIYNLFPFLYQSSFYTNYKEVTTTKAVCRFEDFFEDSNRIFSYNMYK